MAAEQPEYDWNQLFGQADRGGHTDLTIGEIRTVLATILHASPAAIGAYMIVLKEACGNCGQKDCIGGPVRILTSTVDDEDTRANQVALMLSAAVVESIAYRIGDEDEES